MKRRKFRGSTTRLTIGTAVVVMPLAAAFAQGEPEEVVITGSRIARASDFESPSPVITVAHDAIEKSGYSNLQQLMERLPVNGNGAFSTRGNNQDSTANGAASISLRGLGIYTKSGSSFLVMAIIGGAVFTAAMGYISRESNINVAYVVPAICFAIVFLFAWKSRRDTVTAAA